MKKKIILAALVLFVVIALATTVKAATEVTTIEELKDALVGTEEIIQVKNDITDSTSKLKLEVTGTKVLDLDGNTIKLDKSYFVVTGDAALTVNGNGKVETTGSSNMFQCYAENGKGGKLDIQNGTFINSYQAAKLGECGRIVATWGTENDGSVNTIVNIGRDATLVADYGYGVIVFQDVKNGSFNVTVNVAGKIKAGQMGMTIQGFVKATTGNVPVINIEPTANIEGTQGPAIYGAGYGIWNITGGKFVGEEALSIKSGKFNITGGEFIANGEFKATPVAYSNGVESTGSAISITSNSDYAGKIEVSFNGDATVKSENGYAVFEATTKGTSTKVDTLKIAQGSFTGKEGDVKSDNVEKFVEGGSFSKGVDAKYVSDDVKSAEINGKIVYGEAYALTIDEDSKKYLSLDLTEAIEGQLVEVKINEEALEGKYKVKDIIVTYGRGSEVEKLTTTTFNMPNGDVTIKAVLEEVKEDVKEEVKEEVKNPQTGDNIVAYTALLAIAVVGIVATVIVKKK